MGSLLWNKLEQKQDKTMLNPQPLKNWIYSSAFSSQCQVECDYHCVSSSDTHHCKYVTLLWSTAHISQQTVSNWHNSVNLNISRIMHVNKQGIGIFSQLTECARAWYCFCAAISLSISSLGICNSISRPNTIRCLSCVNYWRSFLQKIVSNSGLIPSEIQILRSEIKWCLAEMHENTAVNWASSNHNNLKDDKF